MEDIINCGQYCSAIQYIHIQIHFFESLFLGLVDENKNVIELRVGLLETKFSAMGIETAKDTYTIYHIGFIFIYSGPSPYYSKQNNTYLENCKHLRLLSYQSNTN